MMKTRKNTVKPAMAMVTALFLLGGYSAQTAAGTVDISPTTLSNSNLSGCVSTLATDLECNPAGINLMDNEDDTIRLFSLDADVYGFDVIVVPSVPPFANSDIGSASVLLNDELVGIISTASPSVSAVFADPSITQVIQIVNTDAALLNYDFITTPVPISESSIVAASLPSSRSVQVGSLASAFATIINTSSSTATACSISPRTSVSADFAYQTTDAANAPVGTPNTAVDIPAGASQNFVFGFMPTAPIDPTEVSFDYDCTNSDPAPVTPGVNTLLLSASSTAVPDIVALTATPSGDGIVNLPGTNGSNAFSVATVNNGATDTITADVVTTVSLPVALSICESNPADGQCLSAPASSTTSTVNAGFTPTYSVFATATGTVPFDPALNRIVVTFRDGGGVVRGRTSVAVRTQ
jgi:hypothetical protein